MIHFQAILISDVFIIPNVLHALKSYLCLCSYHYFVAIPIIYHNNKRHNRNDTILGSVYGRKKQCLLHFFFICHFQLFLPSLLIRCRKGETALLSPYAFKALVSNPFWNGQAPAASSCCWRRLQPVLASSLSWKPKQSWVYW